MFPYFRVLTKIRRTMDNLIMNARRQMQSNCYSSNFSFKFDKISICILVIYLSSLRLRFLLSNAAIGWRQSHQHRYCGFLNAYGYQAAICGCETALISHDNMILHRKNQCSSQLFYSTYLFLQQGTSSFFSDNTLLSSLDHLSMQNCYIKELFHLSKVTQVHN